MSLCINGDLIWVSIPKCASYSVEKAFLNSELNLEHHTFDTLDKNQTYPHHHTPLSDLYQKYGYKESVCVTRDFFDKWYSGLKYFWYKCKIKNVETKVKWEDITNDFLYNEFDTEYIQKINLGLYNSKVMNEINSKFVIDGDLKILRTCIGLLVVSQNYWKENKKCTYEFDINELDKFELFIKNRYGVDFKIPYINKLNDDKSNIIKNEELKNWVWKNFEKPFIKTNNLI